MNDQSSISTSSRHADPSSPSSSSSTEWKSIDWNSSIWTNHLRSKIDRDTSLHRSVQFIFTFDFSLGCCGTMLSCTGTMSIGSSNGWRLRSNTFENQSFDQFPLARHWVAGGAWTDLLWSIALLRISIHIDLSTIVSDFDSFDSSWISLQSIEASSPSLHLCSNRTPVSNSQFSTFHLSSMRWISQFSNESMWNVGSFAWNFTSDSPPHAIDPVASSISSIISSRFIEQISFPSIDHHHWHTLRCLCCAPVHRMFIHLFVGSTTQQRWTIDSNAWIEILEWWTRIDCWIVTEWLMLWNDND